MTDTLPPGCAELTFDPNDRATWVGKILKWPFSDNLVPATIVFHGSDKDTCLVVWKNTLGNYEQAWFDRRGFYVGALDWLRLYDAASEPAKPREWWACWNDAIKQWMSPLAGSPELAEADRRAQWRVVRLIESPEDQT